MRRGASFIAAVLLLAAPAFAAPVVGQPAPGFHATVFDGTPIDLADLAGDVVILNFWATWCGPCKRELPLLDAYLRLQASHGLKIVAVHRGLGAAVAPDAAGARRGIPDGPEFPRRLRQGQRAADQFHHRA